MMKIWGTKSLVVRLSKFGACINCKHTMDNASEWESDLSQKNINSHQIVTPTQANS